MISTVLPSAEPGERVEVGYLDEVEPGYYFVIYDSDGQLVHSGGLDYETEPPIASVTQLVAELALIVDLDSRAAVRGLRELLSASSFEERRAIKLLAALM